MTSNLVTQVKHTREVIVLEDQAANDGEPPCERTLAGCAPECGPHNRCTSRAECEAVAIDLAVNEAKKSYGWMRRSIEESAQQKEDDRYLRELRTRGLL